MILITGRNKSGKTTFIDISISTENNFIECPLDQFLNLYKENQSIILIDTPAILCIKRSEVYNGKSLQLNDFKKQDILIEYIRELPNCIIIKNDLTIDDFKVKIKKLLKNI